MAGRIGTAPRALVPTAWRVARPAALGDRGAVLVLLALSLVSLVRELRRPDELIRSDMLAFFLPMFSFLGERLRAGDIPGWNPHQFSGAPFAADPESGWTYFPAMLLFALLPPIGALAAYVVGHVVLAGLAAYALGRVLGLGVVGALATGVVYEFTWQGQAGRCCAPFAQVGLWLPILLLGAELAVRARGWLARVGWWALTGFALSQILAAWLGQGAYYSMLILGSYLFYRTVLVPARPDRRWTDRVGNLAAHGVATLGLGFALAAAGLLPRLEFNPNSTLAGGEYQGNAAWAAETGGWSVADVIHEVMSGYVGGEWWYAGGAALLLAGLAPVVARHWTGTPYFAAYAVGILVLAVGVTTPLHALLFLVLPRFETLHSHYPHRILIVVHLAIALLAGATVGYLSRWEGRRFVLPLATLVGVAVLLLGVPLLVGDVATVSRPTQAAILVAGLLVALYPLVGGLAVRTSLPMLALLGVVLFGAFLVGAPLLVGEAAAGIVVHPLRAALMAAGCLVVLLPLAGGTAARRAIPFVLVLVLFWDPGGRAVTSGALPWVRTPVDLDAYAARSGAAAFLAEAEAGSVPARYVGYSPELLPRLGDLKYGYLRAPDDERTIRTLVNNRATLLGLYDAQGYNPIQVKRYAEYVEALNGEKQEYHETNVFAEGFDSPLLDALGVRYFAVWRPSMTPDSETTELFRGYRNAHIDDRLRILENTEAFPRAWLVHEARQVEEGEALPLLASGDVDPRQTVLLEEEPPVLEGGSGGEVGFVSYEPDRVRLDVRTEAPGVVVLAETYDPAWKASVDGEEAPLLVANHALRGVAVPAGEHRVEVRYESPMLRLGTVVSGGTYGLLALFGAFAGWRRWRDRGAERRGAGAEAPQARAEPTKPFQG